MEPNNTSNHWTTKMGYITAPAMIIAGIIAYNYGDHMIGMGIMLFGVLRLGLLIGLRVKNK
jgi:Zn-dependent membrane protease YugP